MSEKKKLLPFGTRTIVATGLGAAIFMLLFMFVKVPSPIPQTSFQTAYGIAAFFGALFGPIAGALIALIGHAISDAIQFGSPWWSWVVASGISGFLYGISYKFVGFSDGEFRAKDVILFNIIQLGANALSWALIAPSLDVAVYAEPANLVFAQGALAFIFNTVSVGVIGTLLLFVWSKTKIKAGSLKKAE
ncbi:MAG: ECF-type riboflavin transporter substrate-binding protein [Termitinemataceae bacterium]|nr:MAG: ECF-type riboflavin transporter substrate-binding protein [Termitinemataceae bacterium]